MAYMAWTRLKLTVLHAVVTTALLAVSPVFGAAGWAVPLLVLNPLVAGGVSYADAVRRGATSWWWIACPVIWIAQDFLVMRDGDWSSIAFFGAFLLLGVGSGQAAGVLRRRGKRRKAKSFRRRPSRRR